MGDPKMSISRSSGSSNLATVQKITKSSELGLNKPKVITPPLKKKKSRKGNKDIDKVVKKRVIKDVLEINNKSIEEDPEEAFRRNIIEQTQHVSEEADELFKATMHKDMKTKKTILPKQNVSVSKKKEEVFEGEVEDQSVDESIDELKEFLGDSSKQVKSESHPILPGTEIKFEEVPYYDYGKVESKNISFSTSFKKGISIRPLKDDPGVLYEGDFVKSRVFYVGKDHPLYRKCVDGFGDSIPIVYIRQGMLNDVIFGKVFQALYDTIEGVTFDSRLYQLYLGSDIAEVVMAEAIIDYKNTAYYVFFEKLGNHNILNMVLINVDILFTF